MNPFIEGTEFGSINIEGRIIDHDVIIRLSGRVEKRKKKLSKSVFGTSHIISFDEAKYIFEKGTKHLIIGTGQFGMVVLSPEASSYFESKGVKVELLPTPNAIDIWNLSEADTVGLFHVTC